MRTDSVSHVSAPEPVTIKKQIGSVVYEVEIHFDPNARESANDRILRLIRRDMETIR